LSRKKSKKNTWQDHYSRKAQKDNYAARSVYKLQELQKKFGLIRKGDRVLDLGCAPGSWLKYAAELTGSTGTVVGLDIKPVTVKIPAHVTVNQGDIFDPDAALIDKLKKPFNAVISDMAPNTTGNKDVDAARSFRLCEAALNLCHDVLALQGVFVCKIFQGELLQEFQDSVKAEFKRQHLFKPKSSRKASKEIFIIGINFHSKKSMA
jgi:23S rRNA (uridine2552-2'-O)-methyltransferase